MPKKLTQKIFLCLIVLTAAAARSPAQEAREKNIVFDEIAVRNPFISPEGFEKIDTESQIMLEKALSEAQIMGIAIDGQRRYVIINDMIVKEKGQWREIAIDEIGKDYVVVVYRGLKTTIPYQK